MNLLTWRLYNKWLKFRFARRQIRPLGVANLDAPLSLRLKDPAISHSFVILDLETTGLDPKRDRVVSVGAIRVVNGRIRLGEIFNELVNPGRDVPPESIRVHAIVPDMLRHARTAWEVFDDFLAFLGSDTLVAHYASFDLFFMNRVMKEQYGFHLQNLMLDTILMCMYLQGRDESLDHETIIERCRLDNLAERYDVVIPERHTALGDALATALIFQRLLYEIEQDGLSSMGELIKMAAVW